MIKCESCQKEIDVDKLDADVKLIVCITEKCPECYNPKRMPTEIIDCFKSES